MHNNFDRIRLTLPFKAEYVSIARLTAFGVCSRVGFDIETVEDIKVAISEVCSKIVSVGSKTADSYTIMYEVAENVLDIRYFCDDPTIKCIFSAQEDGLAIHIINALMDNVILCDEADYIVAMSKTLEVDV
ncbi:MAG: anti-sigma regulatory factor [Clostridium sp.]|nr:anti-sigma regulatory factor [Clostridium sp.]